MFRGHFGVEFEANNPAPRVSLGTLFPAAQFVDLLWSTLLLLNVESVRIEPGIADWLLRCQSLAALPLRPQT